MNLRTLIRRLQEINDLRHAALDMEVVCESPMAFAHETMGQLSLHSVAVKKDRIVLHLERKTSV